VFCLLGLGMLAVAAWNGYGSWSYLRNAQSAQGIVIALKWSDDAVSSGARPVVRYEVRGDPYEIIGDVWSSPPAYSVGASVRVLYPPGQARAARIESWFDFWFLPTFLGGIGLLFALIGGSLWYLLGRVMRVE
jgi:hypothetical protein